MNNPFNMSEENARWVEQKVDKTKLSSNSRVSCVWDDSGIWVDINYSFDADGSVDDFCLIFCVPDDEKPSAEEWLDALHIAGYLSDRYHLSLDISRD